jgi:hypothetical protein
MYANSIILQDFRCKKLQTNLPIRLLKLVFLYLKIIYCGNFYKKIEFK